MDLTGSQVVSEANVHIETVRYYEKRGLIATAPRNESGYRMFPQQTVSDIQFIKRAQEIHQLALAKVDGSHSSPAFVEKVKALCCSRCEVVVHNKLEQSVAGEFGEKTKAYGIETLPTVTMDGKVVDLKKVKTMKCSMKS